jgi:DNA-binding transcriptional regulator YdaS (Cro superfamily)
MHQAGLLKAIGIVGTQTALAKRLKVRLTRMNNWLNRGIAIPYEYVLAIEALTNGQVTREELAPTVKPTQKDQQYALKKVSNQTLIAELQERLKAGLVKKAELEALCACLRA